MLKNKFKSLLVLAVTSLALVSCDTLIAKPDVYEDNIVNIADKEIVNNMVDVVYDSLHDGSSFATTTVNFIYEKIFTSLFGTYEEITSIVTPDNKFDEAKIKELANKYSGYHELDKDGKRIANSKLETERVKRTYTHIQELIAEDLFEALNVASFKEDNKFSEKLFALSLYKTLFVLDETKPFNSLDFNDDVLLTDEKKLYDKDLEAPNKWIENNEILHLSYYQDYIKKDLLPTILQEILVENYIYNEEYATLGRKYGRQIEYVNISENSSYNGAAKLLCDAFITNNLKTGVNDDFSVLEEAWRGYTVDMTPEATTLLENSGLSFKEFKNSDFEALKGEDKIFNNEDSVKVYEGTRYFDIVNDFSKIKDKIALTDTTIEGTFSGSNTYSYFHGYNLQVNALMLENYTTEGWGVKAVGFESLPDSIKQRLYNINVALDLGNVTPENPSDYLEVVNGESYLLPQSYEQSTINPFLLKNESTYYIVRVDEAASTTKLSLNSQTEGSYDNIEKDGGVKREQIAYEIASVLKANATTKTSALEFYLEESEIFYHDESIYEYFKTTYPDLFKDED